MIDTNLLRQTGMTPRQWAAALDEIDALRAQLAGMVSLSYAEGLLATARALAMEEAAQWIRRMTGGGVVNSDLAIENIRALAPMPPELVAVRRGLLHRCEVWFPLPMDVEDPDAKADLLDLRAALAEMLK